MSAERPGAGHLRPVGDQEKGAGGIERAFETVASGLGDSVGFLASSGILFVIFGFLWVAFAVGLILGQGSVDAAWQAIRDLPWIVQGAVWILFLPVMAGLGIWGTTWPFFLRVVLGVGMGDVRDNRRHLPHAIGSIGARPEGPRRGHQADLVLARPRLLRLRRPPPRPPPAPAPPPGCGGWWLAGG